MSAAPTSTVPAVPAWQWPADVLEFASRNQVADYLEPFRQATYQLFPTLRSFRACVEHDPEIPGESYIVFDVDVPKKAIPDFVHAMHAWSAELTRICPRQLTYVLRLALHRIS